MHSKIKCQNNNVKSIERNDEKIDATLSITLQVVQEYERAVIFRLGRLVTGGTRGPGIFFIIPCIDTYSKVDLRTVSFDVPPQEVCVPVIYESYVLNAARNPFDPELPTSLRTLLISSSHSDLNINDDRVL